MRSEITAPVAPARTFAVRVGSTPRGARLARLLAAAQLGRWGLPRTGHTASAALAVTAGLAANAATHGRVPGRDFELRLLPTADAVRIEVTDTRRDRLPPAPGTLPTPLADSPSGRGPVLAETLAARWGCALHAVPHTTVRAEVALDAPAP